MAQQLDPKILRKEQPLYEVLKSITDNAYIVRRTSDGEHFIGHGWDLEGDFPAEDLKNLLRRGAEAPVWAVLNHENLMSIVGTADDLFFSGSVDHPKRLLLWDFADAGTLDALFKEKPRYPVATGFLPESLCWHVVISMLKALAWLHEGYREGFYLEAHKVGEKNHGHREWKKKGWIMDPDWMPILHRNITPANIFFQHPRGSETYGPCKLGNFGKVFVSGHVNGQSGGAVATVKSGDMAMKELRKTMAVEDIYTIPKVDRPYTKGTELHKLGTILYRMMTGKTLSPEECNRCGCRHMDPSTPKCRHEDCHEDFDPESEMKGLTEYTEHLKEVLLKLLSNYRGGSSSVNTFTCLDYANGRYELWKAEAPDGKLYVDWGEDQKKEMVDSFERVRASHGRNDC